MRSRQGWPQFDGLQERARISGTGSAGKKEDLMSKHIGLLVCLLATALCPSWAAAQVNYKSTMPDGKVIYGDKPVPGAAKVDEIKPTKTQGITPPSAKEAGVLSDLEQGRENRETKDNRLRAAEQAVTRAE